MAAYYNDNDAYVAQWLRNLISAGLIPKGEVDERGIAEVSADDLRGFTQCHFFAGIGGWPYALRLAGWPESRPVWTASLPCQPFSSAGKQQGESDERHLWPVFARLVDQRTPSTIFGEQVSSPLGREWWNEAAHSLEKNNYACGAVVIDAGSIDACHKRARLWWVASDASCEYGASHDCVEQGGSERPQASAGGVPGVHVAGKWWTKGEGAARFPVLVRNYYGLSSTLAGFGNAIVPQVAARFINAYLETQ